MKPQGWQVEGNGDAASTEIRFNQCADDWSSGTEQAACRLGRSRRDRWQMRGLSPGGTRQRKEAASLVQHFAETLKAAIAGDEIEQIAMLQSRGIGPFASGARAEVGALKPNIETTAWCVVDVANRPVTSLTPALGEVITTHGLGLARETTCQFGSGIGHGHVPQTVALSAMASSG